MRKYVLACLLIVLLIFSVVPPSWIPEVPVAPPVQPRHIRIATVEARTMAAWEETLWSGTEGGGVIRWNTRTGEYKRFPDGPPGAYSMDVGPTGNLWVVDGTRYLYSFDGISWKVYPAPDPLPLYVVAADAGGSIWIGPEWGLYSFSAGEWTYYTSSAGLLGNYVVDIAVDSQDRKWFATDRGVSLFDGAQWISYALETIGVGSIWAIEVDPLDRVWLSDGGQEVRRFDGITWAPVPFPADQTYPYIRDIVSDAQGNVWFATPPLDRYAAYKVHRAVIAVNHLDGTWATLDTLDGVPYLDHVCAAADSSGKVYFGSLGDNYFPASGISVFSPAEGWTRLTIPGEILHYAGSTALVIEYPAVSCAGNIEEYESATVRQGIILQTADIMWVAVTTSLAFSPTTAYPIDPSLIPPDIADQYLEAEGNTIPADHPAFVSLAHILTQDVTTEASAVEAIVAWVAENINYDMGWVQPDYPKISPNPWEGLTVFQWRYGVCEGFSNVAVALLRAAGIPARVARGHLIWPDYGDMGGHAWVEAYYPDVGWVPAEPQTTANYVDSHIRMSRWWECPQGTQITWSDGSVRSTMLTALGRDSAAAPVTTDSEHASPLVRPTAFVFVVQEEEGGSACAPLHVRRTYRDWSSTNEEWTATTDQPWLSVTPDRGWVPGYPQVCADASGLPVGRYAGQVTISDRWGATASAGVTLAVLHRQAYLPLVVR